VSDATPTGIRLVHRTMLLQAGASVLAGLVFALAGAAEGLAAFTGGGIATIGTLILGRRMFATGVAPGAVLLAGSLLGTVLRWIWLVGAMWCALSWLRLPALPLIAGVAIGYAAAGLVTLRSR
jgi:F0F1-type ATP synthase assembly protein I